MAQTDSFIKYRDERSNNAIRHRVISGSITRRDQSERAAKEIIWVMNQQNENFPPSFQVEMSKFRDRLWDEFVDEF